MNIDINKLVSLSSEIAAQAGAEALSPEAAMQFCRLVLPHLLAELEVSRRVDERLASMFPVPQPEPAPCEATVCSSRWQEKATDKKQAKKAKKTRAKRRGKDVRTPS